MQSQERTSLASTPLIDTAAYAAVMSYLYQSKPFPLQQPYRVLYPDDPLYARAVANNTDPDSRRVMSGWKGLSRS